MVKKMVAAVVFLALAVAAPCLRAEPADQDPVMTTYRNSLLAQIGKLVAAIPEMTRSAEAAADKLLAGGDLYASGQEAFMIEAFDRAGGLMMLQVLTDKTSLTGKDVLLVGAWANDEETAQAACRRGKAAGAYVVLFSPAFEEPASPLAALCDAHVVNFSLPAGAPIPGRDPKRNLPTSAVFDVAALWTWTGELVGACTRKGRTPVIWESILVPDSETRNAKYDVKDQPAKARFHADLSVPPQEPGRLGRQYLDALRRQVSGLRGIVLDQLAAAGVMMADAVRAGGAVHVQPRSHFIPYEVKSPRVPAWMRPCGPWDSPQRVAAPMKPGDVFFEVGYYELRAPYLDAVRKAGAKAIIALCHAPVAPLDGPQPDFLIDSQWEYGDSAVLLPGYDVEILPASGVLQAAVFWTVTAAAEEKLRNAPR